MKLLKMLIVSLLVMTASISIGQSTETAQPDQTDKIELTPGAIYILDSLKENRNILIRNEDGTFCYMKSSGYGGADNEIEQFTDSLLRADGISEDDPSTLAQKAIQAWESRPKKGDGILAWINWIFGSLGILIVALVGYIWYDKSKRKTKESN